MPGMAPLCPSTAKRLDHLKTDTRPADAVSMGGNAVRWRRYGKDRLYVPAKDGTALGYRDLATGEDHCAQPTRTAEFTATVNEWLRDHSSVPTPASIPPRTPDPATWEDLAQRTAGAMARKQAVEFKDAAPVRTFLARMLDMHTDERAWRLGAEGEEKVAAQLNKLARKDPRWPFLHAIPVGKNSADIPLATKRPRPLCMRPGQPG